MPLQKGTCCFTLVGKEGLNTEMIQGSLQKGSKESYEAKTHEVKF